jgi:hypothetical protein
MKQLSSEAKHHILLQYRPRSPTHGFAALAARAGGGPKASTVQRWHQQWDGSVQSLQRKAVPGRPRALSATQVARHVLPGVRAANRRGEAIHYPALLSSVQQATHKQLSLRTMQRYGAAEGVKQKRSKKRTKGERE